MCVTVSSCRQAGRRVGGLRRHRGGGRGRREQRAAGLPDLTVQPSGDLLPHARRPAYGAPRDGGGAGPGGAERYDERSPLSLCQTLIKASTWNQVVVTSRHFVPAVMLLNVPSGEQIQQNLGENSAFSFGFWVLTCLTSLDLKPAGLIYITGCVIDDESYSTV